ncbi:hypothetical protein K502DRAFT_353811 [Neoconidiobolus thromboides FSU 785]|nr:hypothetical protein K502DRAFT_353811 [Neoconidiobolus thromboides FSU 785]
MFCLSALKHYQNIKCIQQSKSILTSGIRRVSIHRRASIYDGNIDNKDANELIEIYNNSLNFKEMKFSLKLFHTINQNHGDLLERYHFSEIIGKISNSLRLRRIEHSDGIYEKTTDSYIEMRPGVNSYYCNGLKKILKEMIEVRKFKLTIDEWNNVFKAFAIDFDFKYLESLWYTILLNSDIKLKKMNKFNPFFDRNLPAFNNIEISLNMLNSMLSLYSKYPHPTKKYGLEPLENVDQVIDIMNQLQVKKDLQSYINILNAYHFFLKRDNDFVQYSGQLVQHVKFTQTNVRFFNKLMLCYLNRNLFKEIDIIYNRIQPSIQSLNIYIQFKYKQGELGNKVLEYFQSEVNKRYLIPNYVSLNLMLEGIIEQGDMELAEKVVHLFEKEYSVKSNSITFTYLVQGYCAQFDHQSAEKVLIKYMERPDLHLISQPFHHLLKLYNLLKFKEKYDDLLKLFLVSKLKLSFGIFHTILINCLDNLDLNKAIEFFLKSTQHLEEFNNDLLKLLIKINYKLNNQPENLVNLLKLKNSERINYINKYHIFLTNKAD